jgi:hypothetical protein
MAAGTRMMTAAIVDALLATAAPGLSAGPQAPPPVLSELWERPADLASRDLFNGSWGAALAPDPDATYVFVEPKKGGINPGMTVRDPQRRRWK